MKILSLLPFPLLYFLAIPSYYLIYYIFRYRRNVVRENLTNSFPEKSFKEIITIEKTFYKHLSRMIFEIIKMSSISDSELRKRIRFNNLEIVEDYFKRGQSVLACTGHYCNWELGMAALGEKIPNKAYVIYKPLNNRIFDQWFYDIRTRTGNLFVPMKQTLRALARTKEICTAFCFAGDQTPVRSEARYWIEFLNQPTAVLPGLEKIALQTNRPVIYFNMKYVKKGYYEIDCTLLCENPSETKAHQITDMTFSFLENIIKQEPAFWLWSHRRWKHKPENPEQWNQA